ncbi:Uncharacterised protein [Cedecea neteri]|uniref:Uncharacterized protein n=1 Tax=Cedecea neteri TaxID=158822 RepID=A0A291DTM9_9ENTR|nr:hypothetical protein CO704_03340 [Cedecea neteri]SQA99673.1 Uncharacterised protein [Cedecea neteri]
MLSTEKWDNWEKARLLVPFTALTGRYKPIYHRFVTNLLAQSVDKNDIVRSFISRRSSYVTIITL